MTDYEAIRGPDDTDYETVMNELYPYKVWRWHGWMEQP